MLPILKKIRLNGFGHLAIMPEWIEIGIALLNMVDESKCDDFFFIGVYNNEKYPCLYTIQ